MPPLKIDIHTHILPRTWPDLAERYGCDGWPRLEHLDACSARMMIDQRHFRDVKHNCWDVACRLEECDKTGVTAQVLSTVPVMFNYAQQPQHAHDLAQFLNDHIAEVCRDKPTRFAGLGTLPMQSADHAIRELERCVQQLGLPGVQIGTHANGHDLCDREIFVVLEAAAALGAAVFVHPWDMLGKERMGKYWLPWLVGMPAETALAICCAIFGGVLEKLPTLRICFAHGGGAFPFTVGRIDHGFHARPDLCAVDNQVRPRDYLGRFYLDSLVHDCEALRFLVKTMGEGRVAMGSDYPFPLGEDMPGRMIESMSDFSETTKRRLLAGTALEFLNLHESRFSRAVTSATAA
jgi:aminocarboxymuconate-semialdehyde decarboxylase